MIPASRVRADGISFNEWFQSRRSPICDSRINMAYQELGASGMFQSRRSPICDSRPQVPQQLQVWELDSFNLAVVRSVIPASVSPSGLRFRITSFQSRRSPICDSRLAAILAIIAAVILFQSRRSPICDSRGPPEAAARMVIIGFQSRRSPICDSRRPARRQVAAQSPCFNLAVVRSVIPAWAKLVSVRFGKGSFNLAVVRSVIPASISSRA